MWGVAGYLPTFPVITSPIPSIGHNEVIGVCRVGPEAAEPHGREHWAEMLANPRKPVEHWHQLVEVSEAASAMHGHCASVRTPAACADCLWARGSHSTSLSCFPYLDNSLGLAAVVRAAGRIQFVKCSAVGSCYSFPHMLNT